MFRTHFITSVCKRLSNWMNMRREMFFADVCVVMMHWLNKHTPLLSMFYIMNNVVKVMFVRLGLSTAQTLRPNNKLLCIIFLLLLSCLQNSHHCALLVMGNPPARGVVASATRGPVCDITVLGSRSGLPGFDRKNEQSVHQSSRLRHPRTVTISV